MEIQDLERIPPTAPPPTLRETPPASEEETPPPLPEDSGTAVDEYA